MSVPSLHADKTDRMVEFPDNSVLAVYPAYKYAREVEVCMTIVWLYTHVTIHTV